MFQLLQQERFMKTALCSTYTCNELNPPGSFIHCFKTCQSPLIKLQPSLSSGLHLTVCQSDILSFSDEEREKNRQKGKGKKVFLYQKWSIPSLHQQNCVPDVLAVWFFLALIHSILYLY